MKTLNLSEYNTKTKTIWFTFIIFGALSLVYGIFGLLSFNLTQIAFLLATSAVFFVMSQMQIKIPHTESAFWFKEQSVFFAAIWFGVPGAVILAAISTVVCLQFIETSKKNKLFILGTNIFTAFLASEFFYFTLNAVGFSESFVADNQADKVSLVISAVLMCGIYYLANCILFGVFFSVSSANPDDTVFSIFKNSLQFRFFSYFGGLFLAFWIYFTLATYGIAFGLVFLPISIITYITYHFQAQTLTRKSRETSEASRIHLATVEALATAIDARDQIGEGHVRRVQILAVGMGKALELADEEIQALRTSALLHDIGKLAIPDHILNKADKLSPAEMEKMKIHPTVGASILEKVNFNYPVIPAVRHHHENWDGTGYPSKLKGEKIPITARILAIADTYDSIRGEQSYSKSNSSDYAKKTLRDAAGTKYDPRLVDVFMRNLRDFEAELENQQLNYPATTENDGELLPPNETLNTGRLNPGYIEQIKNANKEVFTLYELARVFSASLSLAQTLELFTKKLGELIPFDTCAVYLADETGNFAVAKYVAGQNSEVLKGRKIRFNEGATGSVLQNRQAIHGISPILDLAFCAGEIVADYISMASLPLLTEDKLVGAVTLYSSELQNYGDEHMRLLETISKIAADAISKSISHAETENRSLTDPMTNLPNARSLQIQFEKEVARAYRSKNEFQVLMIDLDGFKKVNDTFGHKVGDAVLREVSKVMLSQLRDYDFLARYAGDEFVAILPETSKDEIQDLMNRMEDAVENLALPVGNDKFAKVGASIGAASYPHNGDTLDLVLISADSAMYAVKAAHKLKEQELHPTPKTISIDNNMLIFELDESHIVSHSIN